ncbi:MAG: hypothetical protein HWD85_07520 [Flavobacteriaceae bacterium]|nr:hypothetical protein [Flavobacteriaceae bacterium]
MKKNFVLVLFVLVLFSCTKEKVAPNPNNLQEYLNLNLGLQQDEVIACAASDEFNTTISYIFFYPIKGATEIQYFETESTQVNEKDFSLYTKKILPKEGVFDGYLQRFIRNDAKEVWGMLTYKTNGKLHKSNPIRLKHQTKPTEWNDKVNVSYVVNNSGTTPKFNWDDGVHKENAIYFQVISDEKNKLLSGTYTYDKWFQYYVLDNVVLNITTTKPPVLQKDVAYYFTMMGVSLDNWVNLVIFKRFIAQ